MFKGFASSTYIGNNVGGVGTNHFGVYLDSLAAAALYVSTMGTLAIGNGSAGSVPGKLHIRDPLNSATNFTSSSLLIDRYYDSNPFSGNHILLREGTQTTTANFIAGIGGAAANTTAFGSYTLQFQIAGNGNMTNRNNSYGSTSDIRIKENIINSRGYLDDLNKLRVVKYSFKSEQSSTQTQLGLIAQEVEEIFPSLVETLQEKQTDDNGEEFYVKSIKTSVINMMMLKAIQELTAKNDELLQRIVTLENK
ncbi:MAG: tail fiber domain-containing protein [Chitinophagia bacterium]|nr:tail fiber domain-containing protein [Chitinophagia bacterium]